MSDPLGLINNVGGMQSPTAPKAQKLPGGGDGPNFRDVLMKNIEQVNQLQQDAEMAIEDLQSGRRDDIANVANAMKKADMAFNLLQQVRNKLVDAYEEVKQMRV